MPRRTDISTGLIRAAEGVGAIATAGAILSVFCNLLVFWMMGLQFFEVATPSDIILSGIKIALFIFAMLLALPILMFPVLILAFIANKVSLVRQYLFYPAVLLFLFIAGYATYEAIQGQFEGVGFDHLVQMSAVLAFIAIGAFARSQGYLALGFTFTLYVCILVLQFSIINSTNLVAIGPAVAGCNQELTVQWMGTESAVVTCGRSEIRPAYKVPVFVVRRDSYTFVRR